MKQTCVLSVSGGVTESLQHDAVCSLNTETITELQMFLRLVQTEKQKKLKLFQQFNFLTLKKFITIFKLYSVKLWNEEVDRWLNDG